MDCNTTLPPLGLGKNTSILGGLAGAGLELDHTSVVPLAVRGHTNSLVGHSELVGQDVRVVGQSVPVVGHTVPVVGQGNCSATVTGHTGLTARIFCCLGTQQKELRVGDGDGGGGGGGDGVGGAIVLPWL